jgi:hypothetical protein
MTRGRALTVLRQFSVNATAQGVGQAVSMKMQTLQPVVVVVVDIRTT